jgi:hypothetical protein
MGGAGLLLAFLVLAGWFVTRRISPGTFLIRLVPSRASKGGLELSVYGPGGEKLGDWPFVGTPPPSVLAGVEKKVPWEAVSKNTSVASPCVVLQVGRTVPEEAVTPVEAMARRGCCPGQKDASACPVRRVMVQR